MKMSIGLSITIAVAIAASAFAQGNPFGAQSCSLCGQGDQTLDVPTSNSDQRIVRFDLCCPYTDSVGDDCVSSASGNAQRATSFNAPLIDDVKGFEDFEISLENVVFSRSSQSCCTTCTCYGDPNCVSFSGKKETWVVCDGRMPGRRQRLGLTKRCHIKEEQCSQEVDAYGEPCEWLPTKTGISVNDWHVPDMGSPCAPKNESFILMYEADDVKIIIGQGERGFITSVSVKFGAKTWNMTAAQCVSSYRQETWTGPAITDYFERYEETKAPQFADIVWDILDPDSMIGLTIRCTATPVDGELTQARLNIESIYEPKNHKVERRGAGGFCVTGDLGNKFPSKNSIDIETNGICYQNGPNAGLDAARAICQNVAIPINGINECYHKFCLQYFLPYYGSPDQCFRAMTDTRDDAAVANGFCGAFASVEIEIEECVETIERLGWKEAVRIYYRRNRPRIEDANCVSKFEDLLDTLPECVPGVELQYLDEASSTWITFKAFEYDLPPCWDAKFRIPYSEYPQLFENKIRFYQKRERSNCLVHKCARKEGFAAVMKTKITTASPTDEPTLSPTKFPTPEPTPEPTLFPTKFPTPEPTPEPTNRPTRDPRFNNPPFALTDAPTPKPTKEPTPFPTKEPTNPTKKPTKEPTPEPTRNPRFVGPPVTPPTRSPTDPPTEPRTNTPTTDIPTETPTKEPTNPTPAPTLPLCPRKDLVPINIKDAELRYNNLAGLGPTPGECEYIWYEKVMKINGEFADLVVREVGETQYRPSNLDPTAPDGVSNNGKFFELGQFQLACDSEVVLEFIFLRSDCKLDSPCDVVDNTKCDIVPESVEGEGIMWKVYDLDQHNGGKNVETAVVCGVNRVQEVFGTLTEITESSFCEDGVLFKSTVFGVEADNPTVQDHEKLNEDQRQKLGQVSLQQGLSRVKVKYGVKGPDRRNYKPRCGRRILFSGDYCEKGIRNRPGPF